MMVVNAFALLFLGLEHLVDMRRRRPPWRAIDLDAVVASIRLAVTTPASDLAGGSTVRRSSIWGVACRSHPLCDCDSQHCDVLVP